jgi:glucans biosynthesis protein C
MPTSRNAAIDHIRILLTALVVFHHVAIAYGGSGGWYFREQPNASNLLLVLFNATNQSYFMGFFFLLAGYYTPPSVERKGPARYLADRLLRLGVPLLVYFFFISTFTIALARTHEGHALWSGWAQMIREREFGPGPLWFAEALLLLAAAYLLWRRLRPARTDIDAASVALPSFRRLAFTAVVLGLINFAVRLAIPVGQEVLWLQLGYFPCYLWLFAAGCAASRSHLLETVTFAQARPWLITSALVAVTLPVLVVVQRGVDGFPGGWNFNALFYALWDPLVAAGAILGLLWFARTRWSRTTPLTAALARNAFPAFIVHPPVAVACSLLAAGWTLPALAKFALVGLLATAGSFAVGGLLRALPGATRIL